jgi:hypothetical protein
VDKKAIALGVKAEECWRWELALGLRKRQESKRADLEVLGFELGSGLWGGGGGGK